MYIFVSSTANDNNKLKKKNKKKNKKRIYLVAYDVNESSQLTAASFFASPDDNINLVFEVGNEGQAW